MKDYLRFLGGIMIAANAVVGSVVFWAWFVTKVVQL